MPTATTVDAYAAGGGRGRARTGDNPEHPSYVTAGRLSLGSSEVQHHISAALVRGAVDHLRAVRRRGAGPRR